MGAPGGEASTRVEVDGEEALAANGSSSSTTTTTSGWGSWCFVFIAFCAVPTAPLSAAQTSIGVNSTPCRVEVRRVGQDGRRMNNKGEGIENVSAVLSKTCASTKRTITVRPLSKQTAAEQQQDLQGLHQEQRSAVPTLLIRSNFE